MAHSYPFSKEIRREHDENSLPYPLVHKTLNPAPFKLPPISKNADQNYVPDDNLTATESSYD
jgi:hypothetical protein